MMMPEPWWSCAVLARPAGEVRQLRQRHVHAEDGGARFQADEAAAQLRVDGALGHQVAEQQLGRHIGGHGARPDALARMQLHAGGPATFDEQRSHRRAGADDSAARLGRPRHGLGDGPHAADGVAPDARLAVDLAEGVVHQEIGRARRIGAGVGPDDAVEGERAFHHLVLEPLRQEIRRALGEQVEQQPLVVQREADAGGGRGRRP